MTIRNIVLWSATDDEGFMRRYVEQHLPLVLDLPGVDRVIVSPLKSRSYSILAELFFRDMDAMRQAFASDVGAAVLADTAELETLFGVDATSAVVMPPISLRLAVAEQCSG